MEIITEEQAVENAKGMTFEKVWEALMENRRQISDLSKNIGGVNNTLGTLTEAMFSPNLYDKFAELGFPVSRQSRDVTFTKNKQKIAEVDVLIENGEYAIVVEIKTKLTEDAIDRHLKRIEAVREYFDAHSDKRKIVGAVAGGNVDNEALEYAHENGLFVIVQSGDSVTIAPSPEGFKVREWVSGNLPVSGMMI